MTQMTQKQFMSLITAVGWKRFVKSGQTTDKAEGSHHMPVLTALLQIFPKWIFSPLQPVGCHNDKSADSRLELD